MNNDDHKHSGHFDAAMPLPEEVRLRNSSSPDARARDSVAAAQNPAADLVRRKVEDAYSNAPPTTAEVQEVSQLDQAEHHSKHQEFIAQLIDSGKPLPEIQSSWHEYYAGLPDTEKHLVWEEFYARHAQTEPKTLPPAHISKPKSTSSHKVYAGRVATDLRRLKANRSGRRGKSAATSPLRSLFFGLGIGLVVVLIFMFGFFNERFIAPFIQPSRSVTNTQIIVGSDAVGSKPEIIIPKINVEIPVVYDLNTIDELAVEKALERGVVHYADTAMPGQDGNLVIVGHSSNNIFNKGRYKFAFVLLSRLEKGDTFYLQRDGVRYTYQVYKKKIVKPTDVSVLGTTDKPATATLITCDPPGTSTNRLVVVGEQISPNPGGNLARSTTNTLATKSAIIPGNSPSLLSRLFKFLSN